MLLKMILNSIEKFKSFIYGKCYIDGEEGKQKIVVEIHPRKNSKGLCPECKKPSPGYDMQPLRRFQYVTLSLQAMEGRRPRPVVRDRLRFTKTARRDA